MLAFMICKADIKFTGNSEQNYSPRLERNIESWYSGTMVNMIENTTKIGLDV